MAGLRPNKEAGRAEECRECGWNLGEQVAEDGRLSRGCGGAG